MLKCEDCGREFTNRDSAILHRKQHNNERTHWCQDCGKGFFKASCLQVRRNGDLCRLSMFYKYQDCLLSSMFVTEAHAIPHGRKAISLRVLQSRILASYNIEKP